MAHACNKAMDETNTLEEGAEGWRNIDVARELQVLLFLSFCLDF